MTGTPPTATRTRTPTQTPDAPHQHATATARPTLPGRQLRRRHRHGHHRARHHRHRQPLRRLRDCPHPALPLRSTTRLQRVNVSSNGNLQFVTINGRLLHQRLPAAQPFNYTIFPYWDDLRTDNHRGTACGIFTSITGSAPNRIFNIEWRANPSGAAHADFEARFFEGSPNFDLVYGSVPGGGAGPPSASSATPARASPNGAATMPGWSRAPASASPCPAASRPAPPPPSDTPTACALE